MIFLKAFLVGGTICAIVQLIIDKTKLTPGRIMVGLVVTGVILGFVGVYDRLVDFAGCGASVPLLGFGNNLWKGMVKAVDENGFIGLFQGGFSAGAAGICAALLFGYIGARIFSLKIKK